MVFVVGALLILFFIVIPAFIVGSFLGGFVGGLMQRFTKVKR
jgi:type III secretory pathway component EscS